LAEALLDNETLESEDIERILKRNTSSKKKKSNRKKTTKR
jgi:hypothetical protein